MRRKDSANRVQNKMNSFIFYAEMQHIFSKDNIFILFFISLPH
ncbi:hypothetical protein BACCELL_01047 [Bacteroides cellulosilyticus DSM 14838]|uniref:Uncharacterized protein n=1 Tax=Bacteroides cellulosilyticus DSM 14838 TaxID=537012 RepID=E2N9V0_9BACE|nr:hypothetical protein BACCELL_01047 [Bacteroides cellulosilyticus DSM 14838]